MKILIAGINGFIGSHIADKLSSEGHEICGIDRFVGSGKYKTDIFDITREDMTTYLKSIEPDVVINCAGQASVPNSIEHPEDDMQENTVLVHKFLFGLQQAKLSDTRFIQLSSAAVYGNPVELPIEEYTEVKPLSPYALHKKMAEDICMFFNQQYGMDVKILRIFSVYGNGLRKQIFWDLYQKYKASGRLSLIGTGNESRDYIHVDDLVDAIQLIVLTDNKEVVWNIASGKEVYISEVAQIYARNLGLTDADVQFDGKVREGDPINWCADITHIRKEGFVPKKSIEQGIAEYINWIRNNE